jgi:hypothetical protein
MVGGKAPFRSRVHVLRATHSLNRGFADQESNSGIVLRTIAVALMLLAAIGGASLLAQTGALGRPTTGRLELVHTLQALTEYRRSSAVIQAGARRYVTGCRHHYVTVNGYLLPEISGRLLQRGGLEATVFELSGCPRPLVRRLSADLLGGAPFDIRRVKADGVRAWEVRLPGTRPLLELFVSRRTGLPVELALHGRRMHGSGDVAYGGRR